MALVNGPVSSPVRDLDAVGLDPAALESGLRARVGDELDEWSIQIELRERNHYVLVLRGPGERFEEQREIELSGQTDEKRSRELAASLALIIDSRVEGADEALAPVPVRGFIALEGGVGLGPPRALDPGLGAGLGGGAWLVRDHLQPRARVAWSHSWSGALRVHQLDVGVGLAVGAPVGESGRLWIGGLAMPGFSWNHIQQVRTATIWTGGGELGVLAQVRLPRWVLGVRTGIETTFPAVRALGSPDVIRFGHLRWMLGLELGAIFGR